MAVITNSPKSRAPKRSGAYTIGRIAFAKISAVEGIVHSRELESDFREFEHKKLSPAERRRRLAMKYGAKA